MILLDTSAWIDILSVNPHFVISKEDVARIVTCPPVVQELLQGIRDDLIHQCFQERLLAFPCLDNPLPLERFLEASDIYRFSRKRGISIRSSVDCLIAAIAIYHRIPVLHKDRDFDALSKFTKLIIIKTI